MPAAVAAIQASGSPSRRRAASYWPAPMTAPATRPPASAEAASLIRPTAAWAAIPAIGKLTKPAIHSSQPLTLKRRGSPWPARHSPGGHAGAVADCADRVCGHGVLPPVVGQGVSQRRPGVSGMRLGWRPRGDAVPSCSGCRLTPVLAQSPAGSRYGTLPVLTNRWCPAAPFHGAAPRAPRAGFELAVLGAGRGAPGGAAAGAACRRLPEPPAATGSLNIPHLLSVLVADGSTAAAPPKRSARGTGHNSEDTNVRSSGPAPPPRGADLIEGPRHVGPTSQAHAAAGVPRLRRAPSAPRSKQITKGGQSI